MPTDRIENLKLSQQKYYFKKKETDPNYVAKREQYNTEYYAVMSQDRAWMDARNKRQRKYHKEWREDRKLKILEQKIEQLKKELAEEESLKD